MYAAGGRSGRRASSPRRRPRFRRHVAAAFRLADRRAEDDHGLRGRAQLRLRNDAVCAPVERAFRALTDAGSRTSRESYLAPSGPSHRGRGPRIDCRRLRRFDHAGDAWRSAARRNRHRRSDHEPDVDRASRAEPRRSDRQGAAGPSGRRAVDRMHGADELLLQVGQWASRTLAAHERRQASRITASSTRGMSRCSRGSRIAARASRTRRTASSMPSEAMQSCIARRSEPNTRISSS